MAIVQYANKNMQSCFNKNENTFVIVVDREVEMVLILKNAFDMDKEECMTNDGSVDELSIDKKMIPLFHKVFPMHKVFPNHKNATNSNTPLTIRQMEVLKQIAKGYTNKQIALNISISPQTVKNHVSSIMERLNASDRTHAVVLAMLNGWLNKEDLSNIRPELKALSSNI